MSLWVPVDAEREAEYLRRGWWERTTLRERVGAHASARPDESAYVWDGTRISWRGYEALIDAIAWRLAATDLRRGDRVLVLLPDGAAVHAAFVACESAGFVAVGVGWRAGERELEHLVGKTGARAAIVAADTRLGPGREVVRRLQLGEPVVIDALGAMPSVADGPTETPRHEPIGPSEPWLLNSTSGTTGLPKCVVQTQNRWVYFHQLAMRFGELGRGTDEVWMSVVPAPFGFGLWTSHVSPTIEGATCVVQSSFDPVSALGAIERERVSVLAAVSSQFVMLLDAHTTEDLSSLRVMFTGGEAISASRARDFEETTGCTILNFYGSNETGLLSGTTVKDPPERRFTSGGRVVEDMAVRLYDGDDRIEGDRGRGRPACRGASLALGYWDDAEANAELYTDDGWMRMGDIVEIDDDGYLTVVGRTSDFIIRGGKNISAAAVEEEVASHPRVRLAAAVPVPDERLGERVGIYVELTDGGLTLVEVGGQLG
ncbi:MAG: class I adenylate-forming enzyme family protein, partial [Actinomycetota bacterium]